MIELGAENCVRSIEQLGEPDIRAEVVYSLPQASVVWADYDAIANDFQQLRFGSLRKRISALGMTEPTDSDLKSIVDNWLLQNAAVISEAQTRQTVVNRRIAATGPPRVAYRAPRCGRVVLMPTRDASLPCVDLSGIQRQEQSDGLLEIKGAGVAPGRIPELSVHGTGLMLLPEAFADIARQRLVEAALQRAGVDVRGVPVYAVFDLGFDTCSPMTDWVPAGSMVRAVRQRPPGGFDVPRTGSELQQVKLEIELTLRLFGITSANFHTRLVIWNDGGQLKAQYGGRDLPFTTPEFLRDLVDELKRPLPLRFEGINIQNTRKYSLRPLRTELIDLSHYEVRNVFDTPVLSLVLDQTFNWGGVLWPDDPAWIQPDPDHAFKHEIAGDRPVPPDLANWSGLRPRGTNLNGAAILGIEIARAVRRGTIGRADIVKKIDDFVKAATGPSDENGR